MNSNYPAGAANDPRAPYNEPEEIEVEVSVRETLVKNDTIWTQSCHRVTEREIEPDGSYSLVSWEEADDVEEEYQNQHYSVIQLLQKFVKILTTLKENRVMYIADMSVSNLLCELEGWEEEEMEVEK